MIIAVFLLQGASCSAVAQDLPYLDMVLDETLRLYPPTSRYLRVMGVLDLHRWRSRYA